MMSTTARSRKAWLTQQAVAILLLVLSVAMVARLFLIEQTVKVCCWQCVLPHPLCDAAQGKF